MQHLAADLLVFAGGDDHAGIGHGDADAGDDLLEDVVGQAVVKDVGVDVVRVLDARHGDGVRAHAVHRLQVLGVHEQAGKLVLILLQAEEDAQAHVVDAAGHGAVHGLGVVVVVVLGAGGVQLQVALLVVGLLEEDVGADAGLLEHAVFLDGGGRDVDVHAADGAVLVLDGVDGADALQDVLDGVVDRVLAGLDGQALVAHVLQGDDLAPHVLLAELDAGDVLVLAVVGTVDAAVDAVVGEVERREHHDAVAVEGELDLLGELIHLLHLFGDLAGQQHGGLPVRQPCADRSGGGVAGAGLFQQAVDEFDVVLVLLRVAERLLNLFVVDEFVRVHGLGVVDCHGGSSFLAVSVHFPSECVAVRGRFASPCTARWSRRS